MYFRFPAVYFGLGLLFKKLNRFEESKKYVILGISFLQKGLAFTSFNWPGLPSKVITETLKDNLEVCLQELLGELNQPKLPEATCRYADCLTHRDQTHIIPSESIYFSDPDYKGHNRLLCNSQCFLEYHKVCWSLYKKEMEGVGVDRDILDKNCLTPDCEGIIVKFEIYDHRGNVEKTLKDEKREKKIKEEEEKKREERKLKKEELQRNKAKNDGNKTKKKKRKSPTPEEEDIQKASVNKYLPTIPLFQGINVHNGLIKKVI